MANSNSTLKNRRNSAAAARQVEPAKAVPYVDEARDFRDIKILSAIRSAITLIEEDDSHSEDACNVLRLARDSLEASWPKTNVKFTAAVSHG